MDVYVGDRVQIVNGGIDVTNGNRAKSGRMYGEGGPLWATVEAIVDGWSTGGKWGLPSKVTKVRCSNNGVVVWQVQPEHIANGTIRSSQPDLIQEQPTPAAPAPVHVDDSWQRDTGSKYQGSSDSYVSRNYYAPKVGTETWSESGGIRSAQQSTDLLPTTAAPDTKVVTDRAVFGVNDPITYPKSKGGVRNLTSNEKKVIGTGSIKVDSSAIEGSVISTSFQNPARRRQILNEDVENIVNPSGFPRKIESAKGLIAAKYDYQIVPADPHFQKVMTLEDKLQQVRVAFGIPVHGSNTIARAMKYYMYNRFKTPDRNLAHNKSVTHVFFTRPDLNILVPGGSTANEQTLNNSETAMVWRRYPELFKLLTDAGRCGDSNNFNMLLSNQVTSFDIQDETLTQNKAGKSWNEYEMVYGDAYSGRTAGEFTCNFLETSDYSIINMLKLWITYIDNVARGAWSPSYELTGEGSEYIDYSHVFSKTLDYAASAYVFKCGPDGEDVLYWSKYYGIFPLNTGAGSLAWDNNNPIGDGPKLSIRFGYSMKRDMSPISLVEFNNIANVPTSGPIVSEASFNTNLGHSSRPYVGAPFIEMKLGDFVMEKDTVNRTRNRTEIRLKFQKYANDDLTDDLVYRYSMADRAFRSNRKS